MGWVFDDGQGRIWGHEIGADFTTGRLVEQLAALEAQRETRRAGEALPEDG